MPRPRLPLDEQAVLQAYAEGRTLPQVAQLLGIDRSRVTRVIDEHDVRRPDERGRTTRGERAGGARLTEDDVRGLRAARTQGATYTTLAVRYGITAHHARQINIGMKWSHVA